MANTVDVMLPLPHRKLSPNARIFWRERNPIKSAARDTAQATCKEAMQRNHCAGFRKAKYKITFFCDYKKARHIDGYRPQDEDNGLGLASIILMDALRLGLSQMIIRKI